VDVAVAVPVAVAVAVAVPVAVGVPDGPAVAVLVPVPVGVGVLQVANVLVPIAVFCVTAGAVMFAVLTKIPLVPVFAQVALAPTNWVIVIVPVAPEAMLPPVQTISGSAGDWSMHVNPLSPTKETMGIATVGGLPPKPPNVPGTLSVTLMPLTVPPVLLVSDTVHVTVPPGFTIGGFPTFRKLNAAGGIAVAVAV